MTVPDRSAQTNAGGWTYRHVADCPSLARRAGSDPFPRLLPAHRPLQQSSGPIPSPSTRPDSSLAYRFTSHPRLKHTRFHGSAKLVSQVLAEPVDAAKIPSSIAKLLTAAVGTNSVAGCRDRELSHRRFRSPRRNYVGPRRHRSSRVTHSPARGVQQWVSSRQQSA